jgi:hypothetical protein
MGKEERESLARYHHKVGSLTSEGDFFDASRSRICHGKGTMVRDNERERRRE